MIELVLAKALVLKQVAASVAVGGLVGVEMERDIGGLMAGVRTHAVASLIGTAIGVITLHTGILELGVGTTIMALLSLVLYLAGQRLIVPVKAHMVLSFFAVYLLGVLIGYQEFVPAAAGSIILSGILVFGHQWGVLQ